MDCDAVMNNSTEPVSLIQTLLNAEATIANSKPDEYANKVRKQIHIQIEALRDPMAPSCYGHDDCSTLILSLCPWRMTCGD